MRITTNLKLILVGISLSLTAQAAVADKFRCQLILKANATDPVGIFDWHDDVTVIRQEVHAPDFATPGTQSETQINFTVKDTKTNLAYRLFLTLGYRFQEKRDAQGTLLSSTQITAFVATVLTSNKRMFQSPTPLSGEGIPVEVKDGVSVFNPLEVKGGDLSLEEFGVLHYSCDYLETVK